MLNYTFEFLTPQIEANLREASTIIDQLPAEECKQAYSYSTIKEVTNNKMPTLKEIATVYQPRQTKNIADLPEVSVDLQVFDGSGTDSAGKAFSYSYTELNGEEYRIPDIVISQLKAILAAKPNTTKVKVSKTGTGLNTKYTVIPLD